METTNKPTKVLTGKVRFSYVQVFEPKPKPGNPKPKYSIQLIIDKDDALTVKRFNRAIEAAIEEGKQKLWRGKRPSNLKLPLRDGDDEKPESEEYENTYFVNCSSTNKPSVVDRDPSEEIYDPTELYSGCYGRATVNLFPFDKEGNRGVAVGLNNIQKLEDGEPLGGGKSDPMDDFAEEYGSKKVKKPKRQDDYDDVF